MLEDQGVAQQGIDTQKLSEGSSHQTLEEYREDDRGDEGVGEHY